MSKSVLLTIRCDDNFIKTIDDAIKNGLAKSRSHLIKKCMADAINMSQDDLDRIFAYPKPLKTCARYTDSQIQEAKKLLNQKIPYSRVSSLAGIDIQTLYTKFPRSLFSEIQTIKTVYSQTVLLKCKEMIDKGEKYKDVAKATGVHVSALYYRFPKGKK